MKIREYTPDLPLDYHEHPYGTAYAGLFIQTVTVEKDVRRIVTYIPEDYFPYQKCQIILVPADEKLEEFVEKSGWVKAAKKNSIGLVFIPANKKWGKPEKELTFIGEAFNQAFHTVGVLSFDHKYAVGYKDSADALVRMILNNSAFFGGAALFGASDITEKDAKKAKDLRKMPVWLINEKGQDTPVLTEYLIQRNNCLKEDLKNKWAAVYNENLLTTDEFWASEACSRIWVSEKQDAAMLSSSVQWCERVFNDFLIKRYHHDHLSVTQLKVDYSMDDIGMKVYKKWMKHASFDKPQLRIFGVYVPTDYDKNKSYPLVVVTHGFQCTYDYSAKNSEFWKIAEQRKFIAVFTQGLPHETTNYGLPRWRSDGHGIMRFNGRKPDGPEEFQDEINYFRYVIEETKKHYNVDNSRIYCTGHSNGAAMTYSLSMEMGDVFAASAQIGGAIPEFNSVEEMPKDHYMMPALSIMCEHDWMTDPFDKESVLYKELLWRKVENHVDPEQDPFIVDNGWTVTHTWLNKDAMPVVKYCFFKDSIHSYHTGAAYYMWDEFLCAFTKDEEGNRYYAGRLIQ